MLEALGIRVLLKKIYCATAWAACIVLFAGIQSASSDAQTSDKNTAFDPSANGSVSASKDNFQIGPQIGPIPPDTPLAAKAYQVLKKHCARCHQAGLLDRPEALGRLANILEIDAIAREGNLVRPGDPDASPLYLNMLTQQMPPHSDRLGGDGDSAGKPVPVVAISDIRTIRRWISDLPKRALSCEGERASDPATAGPLMRDWLKTLTQDEAQDTRFISMLALYNGCSTERERSLYFRALSDVMNLVSQNEQKVQFEALGDDGIILAFRLSQIGWDKRDWKVITAEPPGFSLISQSPEFDNVIAATRTIQPIVPAAWLAERLRTLGDLEQETRRQLTENEPKLLGLDLISGLARRGALPVDLEIGAAELGLTREALAKRLDQVTGPARAAARYLARRGVLKRATFSRVAREVVYGSAEALPLEPSGELFLWTDKLHYKAGDLAVVHAATSTTCFLTVFGVDGNGNTTVLFPNDFDQNNKLVPGREIMVPEPTAPFQLRINNTAPESIVGVCTPQTRNPPAVRHTFERQRFTILGKWENFLDTSLKTERKSRFENGRATGKPPEPQIRAAISLQAE
ncbi:MAG: DUF4384 domain-containing protein [Hyphomicrobiaceae bacterium]